MSVGISVGTALAIGGISAAGAIGSSVIGSKAASSAAKQQAAGQQAGIDETRREFDIAQGNSKPFVDAGQQSIGQLMEALKSGKFGVGSTGNIPTDFKAPTLEEAQQTPGYQFAAQQGSKGILQASAASGGAISGGTSKALQGYETNLANTTYGDAFARKMQEYQANLAGYGTRLAGNQQEFSQLFAPAQLGSGATSSINQTGSTSASNIAQLMAGIGSSKAGSFSPPTVTSTLTGSSASAASISRNRPRSVFCSVPRVT